MIVPAGPIGPRGWPGFVPGRGGPAVDVQPRDRDPSDLARRAANASELISGYPSTLPAPPSAVNPLQFGPMVHKPWKCVSQPFFFSGGGRGGGGGGGKGSNCNNKTHTKNGQTREAGCKESINRE